MFFYKSCKGFLHNFSLGLLFCSDFALSGLECIYNDLEQRVL